MDNKKKILMLCSRPLDHDGLTKIEMDVYRKFKDQAHFEFACAFGFDNIYGDELKRDHVPLHILPPKKKVFSYMKGIEKLVKQEKYDVVYIHGNSAMMAFDSIPAKKAGAKVITHCHNTKSKYPIVHYLMKKSFNDSVDVKIAVSEYAAKWAYSGDRIVIIPNGIDIEKNKYNQSEAQKIREELQVEDSVLVGHVGRFVEQKNHKKIISAFSQYHKFKPTSKLLLIGQGEKQEEIKELVKQNELSDSVIFIDFTDHVQDYLSAMDIMLMPSLYEGLCLVALEAQANGLPLVISETFTPETIVCKEHVKVVNLKDKDQIWAKAIAESVQNGHYQPTAQESKTLDWNEMMEQIGTYLLN